MNAIRIEDLSRVYGTGPTSRHALDRISLSVDTGEVHGLLGPNGAGKTTLCKILSTVLEASSGSAHILGNDVSTQAPAVRRDIGIVFGGDRGLYGRLTARHNLRFWAAMYGLHGRALHTRVAELLERFGLTTQADERVDTFSRGMKQRVHLARGLVGDPRVLLLDEPTIGMDPVAAHDFRRLIAELASESRTILLTTHDMDEAQAVCDRVTLIDAGRILLTGVPGQIGQALTAEQRVTATGASSDVVTQLQRLPGVLSATTGPDGSLLTRTTGTETTRTVLQILLDAGVTQLATPRPTLEETYLTVIGDRGMTVIR